MNPIYIYDLNMFTLGVFLVNNNQRFVNRSGFYLWKQQISSNALLNVAPIHWEYDEDEDGNIL